MSKVFIVNNSGHDFSSAEKFGELVFMTGDLIDKFELTKMRRVFLEILRDSEPGDYILHSGPAIMNVIACGIFIQLHGKINLLIWRVGSEGDDRYVLRRLMFSDIKKEVKQDDSV